MGWPYELIDLTDAEKDARRQSLDWHAFIAQFSALVPVIAFLVFRFGAWTVSKTAPARGTYSAVPGSPQLKHRRLSGVSSWAGGFRAVAWWLGDDVVFLGQNWGRRDQMLAGVMWTFWLLSLCVLGTGHDYLHLTKRFGIVAISQFPVQYLMSLKNLNPFALAFNSSHEQVNRWHRVLGRIIYGLLLAHAALYLNFYVQQGVLSEKLVSLVPVLGIVSIISLSLLNGTALLIIRQYSYRVFFITHLIVALALPPVVYFHAHYSSWYVAEALLVFVADIAKRKFDTVTTETTLEAIAGTDLIKMVAPLPAHKTDLYRQYPAAHIYLNVPLNSRPSLNPASWANLQFEFAFNPFTVANVDEELGNLTLVARQLAGPMTKTLGQVAQRESPNNKVALTIEGPYGCARHFPNLASSDYDRVLLVAGGVGATFIIPLYRAILNENPTTKVQMIWAVRRAGDATWPATGNANSIIEDDKVQLFLTGNLLEGGSSSGRSARGEAVELSSLESDGRRRNKSNTRRNRNNKRPDLQKIVDNVFSQGIEERVAVLVCGPENMARELRRCVGDWVKKGRKVWWHNESFAW